MAVAACGLLQVGPCVTDTLGLVVQQMVLSTLFTVLQTLFYNLLDV